MVNRVVYIFNMIIRISRIYFSKQHLLTDLCCGEIGTQFLSNSEMYARLPTSDFIMHIVTYHMSTFTRGGKR